MAKAKELAEENKKAKEIKGDLLRKKITALGRLGRMYYTLKEEAELILKRRRQKGRRKLTV